MNKLLTLSLFSMLFLASACVIEPSEDGLGLDNSNTPISLVNDSN